jgi:anti-sigma factor RsiW
MNSEMRCGDPVALAGYLYEDIDPAEREAVERHLAGCEVCLSEVEGLRGTRAQLGAWTPPEVTLGFQIASDVAAAPAAEAVACRSHITEMAVADDAGMGAGGGRGRAVRGRRAACGAHER